MSRIVQEAVEAKVKEVRIANIKEGKKERERSKEVRKERIKRKEEDNEGKQSGQGMGNLE